MTQTDASHFTPRSLEDALGQVDNYIQGRMTPEEAAGFEIYAMDQPKLLEQLELSLMLKEGMKHSAAASAATPTRSAPPLAMAATVLVGMAAGTLLGLNLNADDGRSSGLEGGSTGPAQLIDLPIVRGSEFESAAAPLTGDAGVVVLRIPLPVVNADRYRVDIKHEGGAALAPVEGRPTGAGTIDAAVMSSALDHGQYTVTVRRLPDEGIVRTIQLTLSQ
ncbi:MAG: hypothetical protein AAFU65_10040 [Pseudomonadota bacterium]